jgi:NADH-quinone oxidoreductase subunit A
MRMESSVLSSLPVLLFVICAIGLAIGLLIVANIFNPGRPTQVEKMPYESGMDPIHDTRRRFDVRFYLLAIAFLIFDVELLFLYPWAVASGQSAAETRRVGEREIGRQGDKEETDHVSSTALPLSSSPFLENHRLAFFGAMTFLALLTVGYIYDWRKGVFRWR